MKNLITFKQLLLTNILTLAPLLALGIQGGGDAGGAQGVLDQQGNFYFLDILSDAELTSLQLQSAHPSEIISDIKCSDEQYRELKEYEFNGNPNLEKVYPKDGKFETELAEAKKLLNNAGVTLQSELSCPSLQIEGVNKMPNIKSLIPQVEFRSTAFQLPQIADATRTDSKYQIQIAYFEYGRIYFQQQAMLRLKNKARGVFIKETLRYINSKYHLRLENQDLEKATYFIYHGEIEKFKNSVFANKMRTKFPNECREITNDEFFNNEALGRTIARAILPEFLNYLDRTEEEKTFKAFAPENKAWSTLTGQLLDSNSCK